MISILVWFLTDREEKKKAKKEESEFTAKTGRTFSSFLSHNCEFIILSYTTIHINCFLSCSLKSRAGETFFYYYSAKTTIKRVAVKRSLQRETVLFNTKRERERKERELVESKNCAESVDWLRELSLNWDTDIFSREKNY